jgi:hypothetical protein
MAEKNGAKGSSISKMEGVRRALGVLGNDAKPLAIQQYLRDEFRIIMTVAHISNYKSTILGPRKKKGKRGRPKGSKSAKPTMESAAAPVAAKPGTKLSHEDFLAFTELLHKVGADYMMDLIRHSAK